MTRRDLLRPPPPPRPWRGFYFGYKEMGNKPAVKAAIIGTGNEGCQAMIRDHNRDYLDFIGFCDIRPSQQERAVKEFSNHKQYTAADVKKIKKYDDKEEMLADPDVEMVVIALPLWLHAPVAIEAMKAGKHVFCREADGPLASAECKEMCRVARETNKLLADRPPAALLGPLRQRQLPASRTASSATSATSGPSGTATTPSPLVAKDKDGKPVYDPKTGLPEYVRDEQGQHRLPRRLEARPSPRRTRTSTSPSTATRASTSWSAGGSTTAPARA